MRVTDASVVVMALCAAPEGAARALQALTGDLHAPHLLDAEVGSALRRLSLSNALPGARAEQGLTLASLLPITRAPHGPLMARAWELRHTISFYDGLYVALAEHLAAVLVTADQRLARAAAATCACELLD